MVHSRPLTTAVLERASADGDLDVADTLPGAPALHVDDDEEFAALVAHVEDAKAFLKDRAWDNLAHIERFAAGATIGARVIAKFDDDGTRRRVVALLWPLLPVSARTREGHELPAVVDARAPGFFLHPGDVPQISSVYCDFLAPVPSRPTDVVDDLFVAGSGPFLAPRSVCPGVARGTCTAVMLEERAVATASTLPPSMRDSIVPTWNATISRAALGLPGDDVRVRVGSDGQPLRAVDGREELVTVGNDVLSAWLFSAGPDARGLDLRSEDDRALLLCWAHALRGVDVDGKSAFAWLEDDAAPHAVRVRVVETAIACAIRTVERFALDPLACRISLRSADGEWTQLAAAALDACGLFHHVLAGAGSSDRDVVWLDAFLRPGLVGGRMSALASGRAFARLATSVLAPLGVLPLSGFKDGSGAVLLQRLVEVDRARVHGGADGDRARDGGLERAPWVERALPRLVSFDDAGARDEPLFGADGAWASGRGLALPEPKGAPRHDVAAMPAWLAFFLEGLA